jgi:hypothetical protein
MVLVVSKEEDCVVVVVLKVWAACGIVIVPGCNYTSLFALQACDLHERELQSAVRAR